MKIHLEIDCTPEEARRAMGLPDFSPIHDRYLARLQETMESGASPELMEQMLKNWNPMGEASMSMWRSLFDAGTKKAG